MVIDMTKKLDGKVVDLERKKITPPSRLILSCRG